MEKCERQNQRNGEHKMRKELINEYKQKYQQAKIVWEREYRPIDRLATKAKLLDEIVQLLLTDLENAS